MKKLLMLIVVAAAFTACNDVEPGDDPGGDSLRAVITADSLAKIEAPADGTMTMTPVDSLQTGTDSTMKPIDSVKK